MQAGSKMAGKGDTEKTHRGVASEFCPKFQLKLSYQRRQGGWSLEPSSLVSWLCHLLAGT